MIQLDNMYQNEVNVQPTMHPQHTRMPQGYVHVITTSSAQVSYCNKVRLILMRLVYQNDVINLAC